MNKAVYCIATMILVGGAASAWASPFPTELVSYSSSLTGSSLYNDPYAVLGKPSTKFNNRTVANPEIRRVKLVEPAFNVGPSAEKLITTLNTGQQIVVKFDHPVTDDPNNPYGKDFLVFGNSFYTGSGTVSDASNMNTYMLSGGGVFNGAGFFEDVVVSVSQNGTDWYTYSSGPYGDNAYPTNAYLWDSVNAQWTDTETDFTKPVNPNVFNALIGQSGVSAAAAIAAYQGSGGGTGFDLAGTGYDWIQYIKVEGVTGHAGGEIDGFADVAAVPEPATMALLALGAVSMVARRRGRA